MAKRRGCYTMTLKNTIYLGTTKSISFLLLCNKLSKTAAYRNTHLLVQFLWIKSWGMAQLSHLPGVSQASFKLSARHLEAKMGKNPLPNSFRLWAEFISLQWITEGPRFLLALRWTPPAGPKENLQFLEAPDSSCYTGFPNMATSFFQPQEESVSNLLSLKQVTSPSLIPKLQYIRSPRS